MPLCVYAIVAGRLSRRALARARIPRMRLVSAGAVSAVVAECDGKTPISARALRGHDAIVRRVARAASAVLPARFGTSVESESSVVSLLEQWSDQLQEALALVDRREQMTLRLFATEKGAGRKGRTGGTGGRDQEDDPAHPGTSFLQRRAREQAGPAAPELDILREVLKPLVAAERVVRHDQDSLILTAYHLIPKGRAAAYRRLLRRYAAALGHRAVASGPWPPYGFVPELRR